MLELSIHLGGDVDTVASLALAIGSQSVEMKNDLPQWTYDDLENEKYGRVYMEKLDKELFEKFEIPH